MARMCVTGAGGFIGYHLAEELKRRGHWVRGVDIKEPEFAPSTVDEFELVDLRYHGHDVQHAVRGCDIVYNLAANMGGMGHILAHHAEIIRDNLLINASTLEASRLQGVKRYFFSSSVCVYPVDRQMDIDVMVPLSEKDAIPANPMGAYGWEKLVTEQMCKHYFQDYGLETRIARFHNTYGPLGTWCGGREKAPAALCRKVAMAKLVARTKLPQGIKIWGDGKQIRTFTYIDDVVRGIIRLVESDYHDPVNIGDERQISINDLLYLIADTAGIQVLPLHREGPEGVRYRLFDNSLSRQVLDGWKPMVSLEDGIRETYWWIESEVKRSLKREDSNEKIR